MIKRMIVGPSSVSKPFWKATENKQFMLKWCIGCNRPHHYPREVCPYCLGTDLEWRPASGDGEVYAFTIIYRPPMPSLADLVPYVVALIDLAEGPRMMSGVVGCNPNKVKVGMKVKLTWEEIPEGRHLPLFEPAQD